MSHGARLVVPVVWMAVLWMLSSIPTAADQTMAGFFVPKVLQKTLHLIAYALLSSAWLWAFDAGWFATKRRTMAICLPTAYAAIDELHQTFVPGRTGTPWDVALDAVGAMLAVIAMTAFRSPLTDK